MTFEPPDGFTLVDRDAWEALGNMTDAPDGSARQSPGDARDGHVPLAVFVNKQRGEGPLMVAIAGSVAVGKTTVATGLAEGLRAAGVGVAVVSTDGFLLPNSVLEPRGRLGFKGFPDTYDDALMDRVLTALAGGTGHVAVPVYSHAIYDVAGEPVMVAPADVVIVEGVNAFGASASRLRIYIDADEADIRAWFVDRFLGLIEAARDDPTSFFAQWTGLSPADAAGLAVAVWEHVNLVNLNEHIFPQRWDADVVLRKGRDHELEAVAIRSSLWP